MLCTLNFLTNHYKLLNNYNHNLFHWKYIPSHNMTRLMNCVCGHINIFENKEFECWNPNVGILIEYEVRATDTTHWLSFVTSIDYTRV